MPGVGFIGGKLSVIGGYSWPGGVDLLEEFDEVRERKTVFLLQALSVTVTVL